MAGGRYELVDDVPAPPRYELVDESAPSSTLPANAGLANFGASVLGLPVDTITSAYNLFKAGIGTAQNKLLGTPLPELTQAPIGSSENIRGLLRSTGQSGLSPDNPSTTPAGKAQFDLVSRGGFLPGGFLPAAGSMAAERIGGPQWAGVGALAPQAAITGYNAARAPSLARDEARNAVRDETLRRGVDAGYVTPPSASGGGFVSRRLESIGGKAAIGQQAAARNQAVTDDLARRALGMADDAPITVASLERFRNREAQPYREVAALSPRAAAALQELRDARAESTAYWRHYDRSSDPASQRQAVQFGYTAQQLERELEAIAAAAGRQNLIPELRQARTAIAKSYDVERALNIGDAHVSAPIIGRALDRGAPLTGELETIGRFSQAFPQYTREGASLPTPGVSKSEAMLSLGLGMGGYGLGGWPGVAAAALPLASGPTRGVLLSRPYQNAVQPNYGPGMNPAPSPQLLYQLGILEQGKQR